MSDTSEERGELDLTFGVESEFLFGIDHKVYGQDPEFDWPLRVYHGLNDDDYELDNPADLDPNIKDYAFLRQEKMTAKEMLQANKIIRDIRHGRLVTRISPDPPDECESDEYSYWKLTVEKAVRLPRDAQQLSKWSDGKLSATGQQDWKYGQLELISPPLGVPGIGVNSDQTNGLTELDEHLSLFATPLNPSVDYFFMSHAELGSVHVHIGVRPGPDGDQIELSTEYLRHLAFIIMVYEDAISLLHHPERQGYQGTKAFKYAKSNRFAITQDRHRCINGKQFTCEQAFVDIFGAEYRDDLAKLLNSLPGTKGREKGL